MATIQEKLAESLSVLKDYQDEHGDNPVIKGASTLGEIHTKRLVDNGYLKMVIKGWYIPSFPGNEGDSTVWYVSYWPFVVAYLNDKFNDNWCLSPEMSSFLLWLRPSDGKWLSSLLVHWDLFGWHYGCLFMTNQIKASM